MALTKENVRFLLLPVFNVSQAAKAVEEHKDKKKPRDKRNLYLLREGMITPGMEAYESLPEKDKKKRQTLEVALLIILLKILTTLGDFKGKCE